MRLLLGEQWARLAPCLPRNTGKAGARSPTTVAALKGSSIGTAPESHGETCLPGQVHDGQILSLMLGDIRVPRLGRGRPRSTPDALLADRRTPPSRSAQTWRPVASAL